MSNPDFDPTQWVKRLNQSYQSVRFPRGVVGKTSHAMIGLIAVWGVVAWQLSDSWMRNAGLLLAGAIVTLVFVWWVRSTQMFAERNPGQAMLDGAEFLEYQRFEAQAKGMPATHSPPILEPGKPAPQIVDHTERPPEDA